MPSFTCPSCGQPYHLEETAGLQNCWACGEPLPLAGLGGSTVPWQGPTPLVRGPAGPVYRPYQPSALINSEAERAKELPQEVPTAVKELGRYWFCCKNPNATEHHTLIILGSLAVAALF